MLTELHLSNFKSWQQLDMQLGRVTGLFGTNSSGKSSILQFLLMLKQTKEATDRGLVLDLGAQNQLINLGSFKDLIYKHQENIPLKWKLAWKLDDSPINLFCTSVEVILKNKVMKVQSLIHEFQPEYLFKIQADDTSTGKYDVEMVSPNPLRNTENHLHPFNAPPYLDSITEIVNDDPQIRETFCTAFPPIKTHLFPNESTLKQNTGFIEFEYEKMMAKIYYLGPLREYPKREYQWTGASPMGIGYRGEEAINAILAATIRNETRMLPNSTEKKPFQEIIAYWLKELGLIFEFIIKEIADGSNLYQAIVKRDKESPEAFLTDVGFGVSQVLPALVLLYYVPEGSTVLMEQPEIHLHPSVQSGLADVILQVAKHRNIQVIVESHSEHLLRRFQRRIAEEQYPADELKLYFCDSTQGVSTLSDLDIDLFGDIRNWPKNFFGDEMAEIAATRTAALKRKMQDATINGG